MGENIGAAARVMANFGLSELRLVTPRDGWPNFQAQAVAAHAKHIIDAAKVYGTTEEAVADLELVYATCCRMRDMEKPVMTPRELIPTLGNQKTGILFGPERTGLENPDMVRAAAHIFIPVTEEYQSLNLAQAVAVVAYEWFAALTPPPLPQGEGRSAANEKLIAFARQLRKNATDAEKLLWSLLRNRQLEGLKFRRQHPIGEYIADFCSVENKLVIELDGGHHALQEEKDTERTNEIEKLGYKVLRFWNNEVLQNLEGVASTILSHPSPRGRGDRGEGELATQAEVEGMLEHLEGLLDAANFYQVPHKKAKMDQNIRNIFTRARLKSQEVSTLRGIFRALGSKKD